MNASPHAPSMPPMAPLAHPRQDLGHRFHDTSAPGAPRDRPALLWRASVFAPAALATAALLWGFLAWFATDGTTWAEALLSLIHI